MLKLSQADSAPAEWWDEEDSGVGYKISVLSHQLGSILCHHERFLTWFVDQQWIQHSQNPFWVWRLWELTEDLECPFWSTPWIEAGQTSIPCCLLKIRDPIPAEGSLATSVFTCLQEWLRYSLGWSSSGSGCCKHYRVPGTILHGLLGFELPWFYC